MLTNDFATSLSRVPGVGMPKHDEVLATPDADATAVEVVRWALVGDVARIIDNEPGVRSGEDPESVHQARVGIRRFRSTLRTFRGYLEPAWSDELRACLKALGADLGAVRDIDVLRARLAPRLDMCDPGAAREITSRLDARHADVRKRLLATLDADAYAELVASMRDAALAPSVTRPGGDLTGRALLPYAQRAWRRLREAVAALAHDPESRQLHRVRILTKHVRYAAETVVPVAGRASQRFSRKAAALQDALGELQDATFARAWLKESAMAWASPGVAFACGALAGQEIAAEANARTSWPKVWSRLEDKKAARWTEKVAAAPAKKGPVVYLVRHAKAGDREKWTDPDEDRPLTKPGRRQAEGLARMLKHAGVARVLSSPYVRCVQTVEPLAAALELPVGLEPALAEGASLDASLALLEVEQPTVACTHGDVVGNVIEHLAVKGVSGADPYLCEKGSVWVLWIDAGAVCRAEYLPPPA
jgi:CHAD domain-containing protein/phosphohistidine phosphatase SixA